MIDDEEKASILGRYSNRLLKHGHAPETLGWDKHRHMLRYEILLSRWDLRGKSVLDFGCGFGDMYSYLQSTLREVQYTGIDINPELIEVGRRVYPKATLIAADALREGLAGQYDYIFASGVHNLKLRDNQAFLEDTFRLFAKHARLGFALNFLSDKVDYRQKEINYTNPESVLNLAYSYSRRLTLRNDYMPFEFTVFVDRRDEFDPGMAVFPEFLHLVPPFKGPDA